MIGLSKFCLDIILLWLTLFSITHLVTVAMKTHQKKHSNDMRLHNRKYLTNFHKKALNKDILLANGPIVVELMIIADETVYNYHGNDTEHYVSTVMNTVQKLWNSPTLTVNISLQINKLLILYKQPDSLKPVEDASLYLKRFCSWQKDMFSTTSHPVQYDTTLLITRTNLEIDSKYEATGIGYIYGACDIEHRCSVNEDTYPMGLAMTIAHEIGHNVGMWHDGFHDNCPDRVHLMSGYSTGGPLSLLWSHCSADSVNSFISSSKSACLKNVSQVAEINLVDQGPPGLIYDADFQCRMLYGAEARDCTNWTHDNKCGVLKCYPTRQSHSCETDKRPPLDGTKCGPDTICLSGYCKQQTQHNHLPVSTDIKQQTQHNHLPVSMDIKQQTQHNHLPVSTDIKQQTQHNHLPVSMDRDINGLFKQPMSKKQHSDSESSRNNFKTIDKDPDGMDQTILNNDIEQSNLKIEYFLLLALSSSCFLCLVLRLRLRKRRNHKQFTL